MTVWKLMRQSRQPTASVFRVESEVLLNHEDRKSSMEAECG